VTERLRGLAQNGAVVLAVPALLFAVVRPDWYYVQNGLDPFFYTGYVQNFDNIFHASGAEHYFISRWSIYLPQRVLFQVFGDATAAYLVMRWIGAGLIVAAVSVLAARQGRRRSDAVALAALVLLMPMSIRALFADYSDAVVLPAGIALLVLLVCWPDDWRAAAGAGALAGLMVVANPFAITVAAATTPFWLRRVERRSWLSLLAAAAAAGAIVLAAGWLLFRWRYGIPNVYQPTLDFLRERGTQEDPLKSPRLLWLGYRLWIYLPPLVVLAYVLLCRRIREARTSIGDALIGTCALQWTIQFWFQFARRGSTLEISYYWSYALPSFCLAFCVVAGIVASRAHRAVLPGLTAAIVVLLALSDGPMPEVFQSWLDALAAVALVVVVAGRIVSRRPGAVAAVVVVLVLVLQFGSPRPEPMAEGELRVLSSYELVYDNHSDGIDSFRDVVWFDELMDGLPVPVARSAVFWYERPIGARMAAIHGAQVTGRWLLPIIGEAPPTEPFPTDLVNAITAGQIPTIVAIGPAEEVAAVRRQFEAANPEMREVVLAPVPGEDDLLVGVISSLAGPQKTP
jgi:hypothetical protein